MSKQKHKLYLDSPISHGVLLILQSASQICLFLSISTATALGQLLATFVLEDFVINDYPETLKTPYLYQFWTVPTFSHYTSNRVLHICEMKNTQRPHEVLLHDILLFFPQTYWRCN